MKFTTVKTLGNNVYSTRFETAFTDAETELISDFGDPTISVGGNIYGNTVTYTGAIGLNATITQGSARGKMVKDGTIFCFNSTLFTIGGLTGNLATITVVADVSYTLSASNKNLNSEFPYTRSHTTEVKGDIYAATIEKRADTAIVTLRANSDTFSGETVVTL